MTLNKDSVMMALKLCGMDQCCNEDCPYYHISRSVGRCISIVMKDAFELLIGQDQMLEGYPKALPPTWNQGRAYCGACGGKLPRKGHASKRFCPHCGRMVQWE